MKVAVATYLIKQKLILRREKYPLVLMLEPLLACNLECAGCGKIQYPTEILRKRMTPQECWDAAEECGTPIVTVAGGEPLMHPQIGEIIAGLIERKKFISLCTNAILLEKNLHKFKPSPYLFFSVHLDGVEKTHDRMVCRDGVYQQATRAIREAKKQGFVVMTNSTIFQGEDSDEFREFFEFGKNDLKVDGQMIAPGYAYDKAPEQSLFLKREQTRAWFRKTLNGWQKKGWVLNQSPFYLEFLMGRKDYKCTAWGMPLRNVFGWQKPCYLMADGGFAKSYQELLDTTEWSQYGHTSGNPKCTNCMAHVGYESSAVDDAFAHPFEAMQAAMGWGKFKPEPETSSGAAGGTNGHRTVIPISASKEPVGK
jgi:hopanoid biosynthesis associated radical SAM protein HpnH